MNTRQALHASLAVGIALSLVLTVGCSRKTEPASPAAAHSAASSPPPQAATSRPTASRLGDLSSFDAITGHVAALVSHGDLPQAKARIKDLEVAWDAAEAGLKPRAAEDWHRLDKAIDQALAALRADAPRQSDCAAALAHLQQTLAALQGRI